MEVESCVPPGFRFHPTEEELVGYYLTRKVASLKIDIEVIADVDLYRIEPWDLQDRCKYGHEDRNEWYFFSHKDKKYPTGTRTNRATAAGFWKATGRDKAVVSKSKIIGMRKTLVFYEGRAPNGRKSDWIMHEYRLQSTEHGPPQEEGWVVCRAFRKPTPSQRQPFHYWNNPAYYIGANEQMRLMPTPIDIKQKTHFVNSHLVGDYHHEQLLTNCEQELESKQVHLSHLFELPHLNSPSGLPVTKECCDDHHIAPAAFEEHDGKTYDSGGQFIDWKALDKLLGGQVNESTSSSNSNLPPIMLDYEADVQNHGDHFFTSFCS